MGRSCFAALGLALGLALAGCTVTRSGLGDGLDTGPGGADADGSRPDAGTDMDAGTDAAMDGSAERDAAMDGTAAQDGSMDGSAEDDAAADGSAERDAAPDAEVPAAGGALQLDGVDDFVRLTRTVQDDMTIEAWIRTSASRDGSQYYHGLGVVYADVPGANDDFGSAILNDHWVYGTGDPDVTAEGTVTVTSGDWHHVAATRDRSAGEIRIYVDANREATATGSTRRLDDPASIDIGGNTVDSRYFEGFIDEVRIWNIVRTESEIRDDMNRSLDGDESGLVGYYRFDEGSGTTAIDSSPFANDATLGDGDAAAVPTRVDSGAPIFR